MVFRNVVDPDRLRRDEYTGANRCYPCTAVNSVIAVVVSVAGWLLAPPLGVGLFTVSMGAIYFRGYLIPGTPTLTKRYVPDRILSWFDAHPASDNEDRGNYDLEGYLLDRGIVEVCDDEDDLCLSKSVVSPFEGVVDRYRDEPRNRDRVARMFDTDPDTIDGPQRDASSMIIRGRVQRWPSEIAIVADTAMNDTLSKQVSDWDEQPLDMRLQILEGLRSFHESCLACDAPMKAGERTVESCCQSKDVVQVHCTECDSVLFEIDAAVIKAT